MEVVRKKSGEKNVSGKCRPFYNSYHGTYLFRPFSYLTTHFEGRSFTGPAYTTGPDLNRPNLTRPNPTRPVRSDSTREKALPLIVGRQLKLPGRGTSIELQGNVEQGQQVD